MIYFYLFVQPNIPVHFQLQVDTYLHSYQEYLIDVDHFLEIVYLKQQNSQEFARISDSDLKKTFSLKIKLDFIPKSIHTDIDIDRLFLLNNKAILTTTRLL
jgi:hypothetical protein